MEIIQKTTPFETTYDYIIVGGGIAGLYANWKLTNEKKSCLLLEREDVLGGRAYETDFHGTQIKMGAGIMENHNKHLLRLLKKLNIKPNKFKGNFESIPPNNYNINKMVRMIKEKYSSINTTSYKKMPMKEFLIKYFGKEFTKEFIEHCEYADWLESDVDYFINYYKIDDMRVGPYNALIIQWTDLINRLTLPNCIVGVEVNKIKEEGNHYIVKTKDNNYRTKYVIMATSLKPLNRLIRMKDWKYSDMIGTVPFVRIYVWNKQSILKDSDSLPHYFRVENELQKIIKINKNVLMASYSDNKNAKYWIGINKLPKGKIIKIVQEKLEEVLPNNINKIEDIIIVTWDEGVHYYKPHTLESDKFFEKIAHPMKGVCVVGEVVSKKVGWVEGAIESVDRTI
jgi:protoporphyrinogen oxidase